MCTIPYFFLPTQSLWDWGQHTYACMTVIISSDLPYMPLNAQHVHITQSFCMHTYTCMRYAHIQHSACGYKNNVIIITSIEMPFGQQFSNVKCGRLTESEKETLLTRLSEDLERVKMIFARLVSKTLDSLKGRKITYNQLKVLITTYVPKSKVLETKLFSKKKSLEQIFLALRDYWSFFDYELLFLMISTFCTELEEEKNEYTSTFKSFCERKVSEVPTNFTSIATGRHYILRVIIDREFDSVAMTELKKLEIKLRNITKIDLSLLRIEDGSLVIVFVSLNEEDEMLPLSLKDKSELFEMGVLKLYSDNCVYFDYNEYQHSSYMSAPQGIQPLESQLCTLHVVPLDEEWSVDYTLNEDTSKALTSLNLNSHPILSSNPLTWHSHQGKFMFVSEIIIIGASISESHTCRCVRSSISLYPNFGMFGTSPLILPTLPFDLANIAFDPTANHCPLISPT